MSVRSAILGYIRCAMILENISRKLLLVHLAIFSVISTFYSIAFSAKTDLIQNDSTWIALLANYQIRETDFSLALRSDLLFGLGNLRWGYLWQLEPVTLIGVLTGKIYNPYPIAIIFSIGLFICSFSFARKFRAGMEVSLFTAYLVPVSTVFSHAHGLVNGETYQIIPPVLSLLVCAMLLAICIESIDSSSKQSAIFYTALTFIIGIYILAVYPQMAVCAIFFVGATTLGGFCFLIQRRDFRSLKIRASALVIVAAILWLTGAVDFISGYYRYSAYTQNAISEVVPIGLRKVSISYLYDSFFYNGDKYEIVKQIFAFVIVVYLISAIFIKSRRDKLFFSSIWAITFVVSYRLWQTKWTQELGPQFNYLTWFLVPLYATSFSGGLTYSASVLNKIISKIRLFNFSKVLAKSFFYIPILIVALLSTTISQVKEASLSSVGIPVALDKTEQLLARELGISNNSPYRGRLVNGEDRAEYQTLVQGRIPALNDYSHLISPFQYAFSKRFFFDPFQTQSRTHLVYANANAHLYSLFGVQYLRLDWLGSRLSNLSEANSYPAVQYSENDFLVKLKNVNLGNYSPTRTVVARSLDETFQIMDSDSFDPMNEAVVYERLEADFVKVGKTELTVDGGDLRIVANSSGKSLIILPIEFSHCLKFDSNTKNSSLFDYFRIDGILTGLIFENELDVTTSFRYGIFSNNDCRLKDLADFKSLSNE